jgi:hypothetical protein
MHLPSGQRHKHQGINLPILAVRATPLGVMVFANAINRYEKYTPTPQLACKNACHRDAAATAHTAERYGQA